VVAQATSAGEGAALSGGAMSCLPALIGGQNALQKKRRRDGTVILRIVSRPLVAAIFCAAFCAPAFATDNYQTDIGPTPKNGKQGANVQGRGTVLARLDNNSFSLHGEFSGLSSPAIEAQLYMGNVMGGTGPSIGDLTIAQAQSGHISGTFTLTPDQVAALKTGKLYVMLNSQSAPEGNLWGWFQPAHVTVGPDVPQMGHWYIPNLLEHENKGTAKKPNS
jgi:CHRD domain